jgi:uncharacterized protein YggT (Ycf19 family)
MLHRFAAACAVGSVVVAAGALLSLLLRLPVEGAWMLTTVWCFVPVVWGVWAMLAPSRWVPTRLPTWGAILGVGAGAVIGPLLNLPARLGAPDFSPWLALFIAPLIYYALWLLVKTVYCLLHGTGESTQGIAGRFEHVA